MKTVPFTEDLVVEITKQYPTPFYIYDEQGIRQSINALQAAFGWNTGFREYFAIKALPNPHILAIMKAADCGVDASSLAELVLAERAVLKGEEIMFTANNTTLEEYQKAEALGAIINLDCVEDMEKVKQLKTLPEVLCFRFTPETIAGANEIIGSSKEAKFGMNQEQVESVLQQAQTLGIQRLGIHAMLSSNELDAERYAKNSIFLLRFVKEIEERYNMSIEFLNIGGGIGIPYHEEEEPFDVSFLGQAVKEEYEQLGFQNLKIFMECGRYITGPHGYLVTAVNNVKETYRKYIQVDASMQNLMRPGMYDAYHAISALGKGNEKNTETYDVVGSLCENNDKFARDRELPTVAKGDVLVIHDAGAHGHAMGFNYNGKLRSAEFLWNKEQGGCTMIRRAETLDDLFATLVD